MALSFSPLEDYGREIKSLGQGTYGVVIATDEGYVIKRICNNGIDTYIPSKSALFEIVSLLKISSPYVIPLIDVNVGREATSLILPLAKGPLNAYMGKIDFDIQEVAWQICRGLADVHNANILHLDLKPENIFVRNISSPAIWIGDFGISKIHPNNRLRGSYFTLWYRAPEVFLGDEVTTKADVWAVGVIIAEMLLSRRKCRPQRLFPGHGHLDQLNRIFQLTGTPHRQSWPWIANLPDRGNYLSLIGDFNRKLETYLADGGLSQEEIEFITNILIIDPNQRPTIFQVLQSSWFGDREDIPLPFTHQQIISKYAAHSNNNWHSILPRQLILDITIQVCNTFELSDETLSLAVYLLDEIQPVNQGEINFWGLACIYLASVFCDMEAINADDVSMISSNIYSPKQIRMGAANVAIHTCFKLAEATSLFFLQPRNKTTIQLWTGSLLTIHHFKPPRQIADDIIILSNPSFHLRRSARKLRGDLLILSLDSPMMTFSPNLRNYLNQRL